MSSEYAQWCTPVEIQKEQNARHKKVISLMQSQVTKMKESLDQITDLVENTQNQSKPEK